MLRGTGFCVVRVLGREKQGEKSGRVYLTSLALLRITHPSMRFYGY